MISTTSIVATIQLPTSPMPPCKEQTICKRKKKRFLTVPGGTLLHHDLEGTLEGGHLSGDESEGSCSLRLTMLIVGQCVLYQHTAEGVNLREERGREERG